MKRWIVTILYEDGHELDFVVEAETDEAAEKAVLKDHCPSSEIVAMTIKPREETK